MVPKIGGMLGNTTGTSLEFVPFPDALCRFVVSAILVLTVAPHLFLVSPQAFVGLYGWLLTTQRGVRAEHLRSKDVPSLL
jgi:hypothetical protein